MMIGGDHKYSISPEEYIFAALAIYLDIINIFMYLLRSNIIIIISVSFWLMVIFLGLLVLQGQTKEAQRGEEKTQRASSAKYICYSFA